MNNTNQLNELLEKLKTERDQIKLKIHLAGQDAKDEWSKLEEKWKPFTDKVHQAEVAAENSTQDIKAAAELLGQEIKKGFENIKNSF